MIGILGAQRKPLSEYEWISKEEFKSNSFGEKYQGHFVINGNIVPHSSEIIEELARKMQKTQKATYLQVKRRFIEQPIQQKPVTEIFKDREAEKVDCEYPKKGNSEMCASIEEKESFVHTYEIEDDSIFILKWIKRKHRNRTVVSETFEAGWQSKLALFLYEEAKITCKFYFKNAWITKERKFATLGNCECGASADISYHQNRLSVNIKNIAQSFPHKRTYQIRGELKKKFFPDLQRDSALAARMKFINKMIPDNNELNKKFHPFNSTLNAIRLHKCREQRKEEDPVDVLLQWKDTKFQNVILAIGHSPFFMFYRTALQLAWYVIESKNGDIIISIDATGGLVTPPFRSQKIEGSERLKHVFFYSIMVKTSTKSIPIAQMLSQEQTSEFIVFFLRKTFKGLKAPRQIVCDESKALLKSLCIAFANFEKIGDYIAACMSSILDGTEHPKCYIRIDRSHFVKNTTKKIKYRDFRKQNLFRSIFGFLIQCNDFRIARKVIRDFFTVILNQKDGVDEFGVPLPSEEARKRLFALCSTHNESEDYGNDSECPEDEEVEKNMDFDAESGWIEDIIKEVPIKNENTYHDSVYFSGTDKEKKMYVKMLSSIVLWSNIMNPIFGSSMEVATSSDVESYFKSLKTGILERKMHRADDFFEVHTDFVNAEIKINAISSKEPEPDEPKPRGRSNSLHLRSPIPLGNLLLLKYIFIRY